MVNDERSSWALPLQIPADAQRQGLGQSGKLSAGRRRHPAEPLRVILALP